jgi:hypothetical protein
MGLHQVHIGRIHYNVFEGGKREAGQGLFGREIGGIVHDKGWIDIDGCDPIEKNRFRRIVHEERIDGSGTERVSGGRLGLCIGVKEMEEFDGEMTVRGDTVLELADRTNRVFVDMTGHGFGIDKGLFLWLLCLWLLCLWLLLFLWLLCLQLLGHSKKR